MSETFDVIVVGGGVGGLAVADGLVKAGKTAKVFEARDRLGGRIETAVVPGGVADLGPTWFWHGEHRVQKLVAALGLDTHDQWTTGATMILSNGQAARYEDYQPPHAFRLSGGVSGLIDGLAARLPDGVVALNSPVSQLVPTLDGVKASVAGETFVAAAGVVALPPSLAISHGLIDKSTLSPQAGEVAASVAVWMGDITKAVAVYETPFWRDAGLSGFASCQQGLFGEIHDMSGPGGKSAMLFGFGRSHPDSPPASAQAFVEQLTLLFGAEAAAPTDVMVRDWRAERWTTPDVWPPSQRFDLFGSPELQKPAWDGKLFWSSTETSPVSPGHIEGALAAAERTVQQLTSEQ